MEDKLISVGSTFWKVTLNIFGSFEVIIVLLKPSISANIKLLSHSFFYRFPSEEKKKSQIYV